MTRSVIDRTSERLILSTAYQYDVISTVVFFPDDVMSTADLILAPHVSAVVRSGGAFFCCEGSFFSSTSLNYYAKEKS
jgi:hypothetical protein